MNSSGHPSSPTSSATVNVTHSESTPLLRNAQKNQQQLQYQHNKRREIIGLLFMTLSALGFSTMSLFVKLSGTSFPSFEIVFARSVVQTVFSLLGCAILKVNPLGQPGVRRWLLFRGLAGTLGLCLFFYSITQLPLADATVVFFLGPAFTAILASIVLGEAFTLFDGICSIACMAGVVLVSKPQFLFGGHDGPKDRDISEWQRLFAVLCALVGAMMSAVAYVTVRKIGRGAHYMVHVVYFGLVSIVVAPIGMTVFQTPVMPQGGYEYGMLLLVGLSAFVGQCFLNQGLQMAPAGPGTLMRMNDVVFAFLFGIFVLHEYPDVYSISGASIIVLMTSAMGIHKIYTHTKK
ncbi:solute carrier family 35 member G1-like [Mucor ambiguus]|uniref:Solute carrier family 35 member G1-like n=1 Tax=Mucor ambiguus TaxID=91626 RepID=A0A0C9MBK2_9FUNG|nr:solute carrier family 35 member G1-like [Mucor ambiguus]